MHNRVCSVLLSMVFLAIAGWIAYSLLQIRQENVPLPEPPPEAPKRQIPQRNEPSQRLSPTESSPKEQSKQIPPRTDPPLACLDGAPTAQEMSAKHGERARQLFMAVNFQEHPEDLERVAKAVEREDDLILALNEKYGLPFALLLVPPDTDKGAKRFPEVVRHALRTMPDRSLALALLIAERDEICAMLDAGKSVQDLAESVDLFCTLTPLVQELAVDHTRTLRLLAESWHGQKLGVDVLRKCGFQAVDLVYTNYAGDDRLKWPALLALAKLGWPAYGVLDKYKRYGPFLKLLQRAERDGLLNPQDNSPLIVPALRDVAQHGQQRVDIYAEVENLKGQILREVRGPAPEDAVLEWVPGYVFYRITMNWKDGYHVTGGDVFWAAVDAASTTTLVYGLAANATKSILQKTAQQSAKEVGSKTSIQLGKQPGRVAVQVMKHEGVELRRFGARATEIAEDRLKARLEGLSLNLVDRQPEYLELVRAGNINGKARLVEEIGEEGARTYAERVGYETIYRGKPGKGMGFDQVYRDGNRIKVFEVKGGDSPLKTYRGYEQGTKEYTKEVAEWTVKSPSVAAEDKKMAEEVLSALKQNRLDIEVVRTKHVQGKPGATRVEKIIGSQPRVMSSQEVHDLLVRTPGVGLAWVNQTAALREYLSLEDRLNIARPFARRAGIALWDKGKGPLANPEVPHKDVSIPPSPAVAPARTTVEPVDDATPREAVNGPIEAFQKHYAEAALETKIKLAAIVMLVLLAIPLVRRLLWHRLITRLWRKSSALPAAKTVLSSHEPLHE